LKKNNKEEKELNKCNCTEECDCGCQEGKECTCDECHCDDECHCGDDCCCDDECDCCDCDDCEEDAGCCGDCGGCGGCGSMDDATVSQILAARNQELEEKYMRLQAEYLNFKTRTQSEVSRMLQYEGEDFIKEILNIKDNFERAVMMDDNDLSDEVSRFLSGFKMILGNLTNVLDKFEVKEIECVGLEFDPHVAEAVLTDHNEDKPENVVLEVLTKGYKYKDKVIRHAMVKVNK
jgi:molecular chaperone GrpE